MFIDFPHALFELNANMNIPEFNTDLVNSAVSGLDNMMPTSNETMSTVFDYLYDMQDTNVNTNNTLQSPVGSQHLAAILQQLFSKISDNRTSISGQNTSNSAAVSTSFSLANGEFSSAFLSLGFHLPISTSDVNSYRLLSIVSLWFVLIINPIVILFGVFGNLLATYILINCNIAKLPVSFYTIMLNISDTLNLLIPVFIFWLDNCFNRTPERGYFRDKSNFLCKALMCPDQLFAALSAWYMCAISFNRWYSVCRPSSYFFRMSSNPTRATTNGITQHRNGTNNRKEEFDFQRPTFFSSICLLSWNQCFCLTRNLKYRQHMQAFRSIGIITLLGILCCLYPIFMHELRSVVSTNEHVYDALTKVSRSYAVVWKRCYYSRKHEYAYDIIGIILSCLLHILPLTFVAAMSLMIILKLKQRQNMMSASTSRSQAISSIIKKPRTNDCLDPTTNEATIPLRNAHVRFNNEQVKIKELPSTSCSLTTHKDQATSTDPAGSATRVKVSNGPAKSNANIIRRHHSRDRNITIMLVSIALSYLILTLPYRLFWSYNVYIKRMHPENLNSSSYLLKMHYIDHVLRTIRNIHYATNFISFIFLSKTFRRKFRQLCLGRLLRLSRRLCPRTLANPSDLNANEVDSHRISLKPKEKRVKPTNFSGIFDGRVSATDYDQREIGKEVTTYAADARVHQEEEEEENRHLVMEFQNDEKSRLNNDK